MMRIVRHRLCDDDGAPCAYVKSPNHGGALAPQYLVLHYTAGASAESSIRHLTDKRNKASAHLVIGRDGAVTQLVPFNRVAWHAGKSKWHGLEGLNQYAIGIELDNAGPLQQREDGVWCTWFGRACEDSDVVVAQHPDETEPRGWQCYPDAQIETALTVAQALDDHYGLREVLGHADIAPGRKRDPGPAFPMASFEAVVDGRQDDAMSRLQTISTLNIRAGPDTSFEKLRKALPKGTQLSLLSRQGFWYFVEVLDRNDEPNLNGWVHGHYVRPLAAADAAP